jgi:hypothetical protein
MSSGYLLRADRIAIRETVRMAFHPVGGHTLTNVCTADLHRLATYDRA